MTTVETTLGPLPVDTLGWINAHDHVIMDGGYTVVKTPDFKLDSVEKSVEEMGYWLAAGGGAVVDAQPFGCGRNVRKLIAVSQQTKLPIIVPTGFQSKAFYLPDHWQYKYDVDVMAELIYQEVVEGVDLNGYESPIVERSPVKAGFMKVASDYQVVSEHTRRHIQVAGQVHKQTGVPILVHTGSGTAADIVLDLLEAEGIAPSNVMLCHMDRNPDFYVHRKLAERGAYVQYDTPSRIKYQPEHLVVELMRDMFEAGLGERVLLGGDMARRSYWKAYGGGPGFDYLLTSFTPRLRDTGFTDDELETIWHHNPARWLTSGQAK
jgi:predicted metal-dependent phosphotriesterase family hydrolase